jgi:hypothetical protein
MPVAAHSSSRGFSDHTLQIPSASELENTQTHIRSLLFADTPQTDLTFQYHTESDAQTLDSITASTSSQPETIDPLSATEVPLRRVNPYVDSTAHMVTSRRTKLFTSSWTNSNVLATKLFQIPYCDKFTQNSSILAAAQNFLAMRWKSISIEVEVSSVSTLRGSLKLYTLPVAPNFGSADNINMYMQAEGFSINATSMPSSKIDLPWRFPVDAVGIANVLANPVNYGFFGLIVEAPLCSDLPPGAACTVPYTVYVTFNDLEFLLPCPTQSYVASTNTLTPVVVAIPTLNVLAQSSREAQEKSKGTISGAFEAASSVAAAIASVPVAAPLASPIAVGLSLASSVAKGLGFSKPENISTTTFTNTYPYRDTNQTHGLSDALVLHGDPAQKIASGVELFNVKDDEMDLLRQAQIPSPLAYYTVGSSTSTPIFNMAVYLSTIQKVAASAINSSFNINHDTRLSRACRFASHWSGSLIYTARVYASSVIRGKLAWIWSPVASYDYNTCRKLEFDLNGTTVIDFEVPWAALQDWLPIAFEQGSTNHRMSNGFVYLISLTNPSASGNASTAAINITIDIRAGPGFSLQGTRPLTGLGYQHLAGNETVGGLSGFAKKQGGETVMNLNFDENDHHLRVLAHRTFATNKQAAAVAATINLNSLPTDTDLEFMMAGFAYYRSSFIIRGINVSGVMSKAAPFYAIMSDSNTSVFNVTDGLYTPKGSLPYAYQDMFQNGQFAVKFHWQSNVRAFQTSNNFGVITEISQSSYPTLTVTTRDASAAMNLTISACDDFLLSGLLPSPGVATISTGY